MLPTSCRCDAPVARRRAPTARSAGLRPGPRSSRREYDVSVLPAAEGQAEVIEPVIEGCTGNHHAKIGHIGEVGQTQTARHRLLPEDNIPLGTVERSPGSDPPLQGAPHAGTDLGMAVADLVKHGDGTQTGSVLQHWRDLAIPDCSQRVRTAATARHLLL